MVLKGVRMTSGSQPMMAFWPELGTQETLPLDSRTIDFYRCWEGFSLAFEIGNCAPEETSMSLGFHTGQSVPLEDVGLGAAVMRTGARRGS